MDDVELRLNALETLIIEWLAVQPDGVLRQIDDSIAAGLPERGSPSRDADEHDMRRHALELIQEARMRFDAFTTGVRIVPPR